LVPIVRPPGATGREWKIYPHGLAFQGPTARPFRGRPGVTLKRGPTRSLQFLDAGAVATAEVGRFRPVGREVMSVGPRAVPFNVLPNTRLETSVGPGAVRAVVVGVGLAANQTAVTRGDHGTGGVARKVAVHVTRRQGLGGDRLGPEREAGAPDMVAHAVSVLVVRAGTPTLAHVNTALFAGVTGVHRDDGRTLALADRGAVGVGDGQNALQGPAGSRFNIATLNFLVVVVVHGFSLQRPPLACLSRRALLRRKAPQGTGLSLPTRMSAKVIKVRGRISDMADSNAERDAETGKYRASHEGHEFVKAVAREGDIATTSDVADRVGCAHRTALMYLNDLEDEGRIESTKAGRAKVWSRSD